MFLLSMCSCSKQKKYDYPTIGELKVNHYSFYHYIEENESIEVLGDGFSWSEGPLWLEKRNKLIFSDVPKNTIYEWKDGIGVNIWLQPSGYTKSKLKEGSTGSNGLALYNNGKLLLCQHGDRRLAMMEADFNFPKPQFRTIADRFRNKAFNSPNDLAVHRNGRVYFTDPPYGLAQEDNNPNKQLTFNGVYVVDKQGKVTLLDKNMRRPNGIALSPDFKKCYVANSDKNRPIIKEYKLKPDGSFGESKLFFNANHIVNDLPGLPDGLKVHSDGTVFATGPGGVLIISKFGEHLGTISTGKAISNCAFDSKEEYLYMTSSDMICRIKLKEVKKIDY